MNSLAITKPSKPQPGKVSTQASAISPTIFQFTAESLREAPTPMMAVVFVYVVLTGMPVSEESSRQSDAPASAAKP